MIGRSGGTGRRTALPVLLAGGLLLVLPLAGCGQDGSGDETGIGDAEMTSPAPSTPGSSTPGPGESSRRPSPDPSTGGPTRSTPPPAGDVLTMSDASRVVRMAVGDSISLRLDPPWRWETTVESGDAVQVYPVDYVADPGYQEWVIQAVRSGTATVRAFGDAMCPPGAQCLIGDKIVEISVQVTR